MVVDSSVLVHALGQLKVWCQSGREEVIAVPLEDMCMRVPTFHRRLLMHACVNFSFYAV